jgi:hypothetical protein
MGPEKKVDEHRNVNPMFLIRIRTTVENKRSGGRDGN